MLKNAKKRKKLRVFLLKSAEEMRIFGPILIVDIVGRNVLNRIGVRALWGWGGARRSPALIKREPRLNKCGASRGRRRGGGEGPGFTIFAILHAIEPFGCTVVV